MLTNEEANKWLDNVIEQRRTIRAFKTDIPAKKDVEAIIHAGLWAPYAAIAVGDRQDFRKFFVVQNGSPALGKIAELIQQQAKVSLQEMEKQFKKKPFLEKRERHT